MSIIGEGVDFAAYLGDSAAAIVGLHTNLASEAELATGDVQVAGNTYASDADNAAEAASQSADIQGSEATTLTEQNAQIGLPQGGLLGLVPTWAWWVGGAVVALVVLSQVSSIARVLKP